MQRDVPNRLVEHGLQASLRQGRTLDVFDGTNLLPDLVRAFPVDGFHAFRLQRLARGRIFSQIQLGADQDDGHVGCVMLNLGIPLALTVSVGVW